MHTVEAARLAILANQQEIAILLAKSPVDRLAVQNLQSENARHLDRIASAQNLIHATPRQSRVDIVLSQFVPRAFVR